MIEYFTVIGQMIFWHTIVLYFQFGEDKYQSTDSVNSKEKWSANGSKGEP